MTKKVLVVDDSLTVRQQVGQALTKAGFTVVEAIDGRDGLERLSSVRDIAAVVTDVHMPEMDGIEMLEKIRTNPDHAALPVLMLTTEGASSLIQRVKELGAKGWVVKPFKSELLVAAVGRLVK